MVTLNPHRAVGIAMVALTALLLGGCAPGPRLRDERLDLHAVRFDADGKTIDLQTGKPRSANQTKAQFDKILDAMDASQSDRRTRKILLFVHGGLNKPEDVLDRIKEQLDDFEQHPVDFYPIYVVWDSSLDATYAEHLFAVRQGRKDSRTRAAAAWSWPIYLLSDIMRAAARAPTVWLQQRTTDDQAVAAAWASMFGAESDGNDARRSSTRPAATRPSRTQAWLHHPRNDKTVAFFDVLYDKYLADWHANGKQTSQIAISIGQDDSEPSDWLGRGAFYGLTFPTKMLTSPLIDALGSAAWRDMSRRTQTIVEGASDFEIGQGNIRDYVNNGAPGGLDAFFRRLASRQHDPRPGHPSYDITLVGHSMGSMVLNEALRRQTRREQDGGDALPVTKIIYMAAACSIRDFTESVIPFMALHERARFYNLCLHPTAELIESNVYDIPPRGSLLAWIDDFLTEPSTPLDRTLGRWENLVQVPYVIPAKMRGRVAIKAFDLLRPGQAWYARPDPQPQQHGDFSGAPYWDENFITPTEPEEPGQRRIKSATTRRVGNLEREAQPQRQAGE